MHKAVKKLRGVNGNRSITDLRGKRYGALVVYKLGTPSINGAQYSTRWWVRCDCGKKKLMLGQSLVNGLSRSCSCGRSTTRWKHGLWRTLQYTIWSAAKKRAKVSGVDFNITVHDVFIPKRCPVFGFILKQGAGPGCTDKSPTLDRIINSHGYTTGNVWVISGKANKAKSNLTLRELKQLAKVLSRKMRS